MNKVKKWFKKNRTLLTGLAATLVLFLLMIPLFDYVIMPLYTNKGAERELPDVTEIHYDDAEKVLGDHGFQVIVDHAQHDATYPESTVIYQDPEPFTRVKRGRRIYVVLSRGERLVMVPKVVGRSERDAGFDLNQAGLRLGEVFYEYNDYSSRGIVTQQSRDPDIEVVAETPIDIWVSNGRLPSRFQVPDVIGQSLSSAKRLLRQAGLRVGNIEFEINENLIPETVITQSIDPDSEVNKGTAIHLVVSELDEVIFP